ncbi:MAG: hypothetical protein RIC95_07865 [Vicingaceae bacterium]
MKVKPILIALFVGLLFSACSIVKNPTASTNFKRVKYRANLSLPKAKVEKQLSVTSFKANENLQEKVDQTLTKSDQLNPKGFLSLKKAGLVPQPLAAQKLTYSPQREQRKYHLLQSAKQWSEQMETNPVLSNDPWWESDPEEWPWKEIILATIVVLLIILAVYLLVSFLGGVVGGIIGLILLLALLYLLFDYYG